MSRRKSFARWMIVAVLALGLTTAAVSAQDWPRYRRDAARTASVEESLSFPLHPRWVYEPDRPPRPAWPDPVLEPHRVPFDYAPVPVAAGGLFYFGSTTDDSVRALDAGSGEVVWRFTTGGPVRFAPDISGGRAYFGSDDGYLYCVDARTGDLVWRFQASRTDEMVLGNERMISRRPLRSGVLVDDGVVYTTAGMWPAEGVIVYALEAQTGEVIWTNGTTLGYMAQPHGGYAMTSPTPQGYLALGNDILLVASARAVPAAFDRSDGRLLYFDQRTDTDRSAALGSCWLAVDAPSDVFFNASVTGDKAFRLSTGKPAGGGGVSYVPEGAVRAGEVLVRGADGRVTAEGAEWSADVDGYARRLAVADGRLYVSTDTGRIYCFAPGEAAGGAPRTVSRPRAETEAEAGPLARDVLALLAERRLDRGYALVLGDPEPDLARAIGAATEMHVLQVLASEDAARAARERLLDSTQLYGSRVAVTHLPEGGALPFPPHFANVIVGGPETLGVAADDVHRVLRPAGGLWLPGPGWTPPDELELHRVAREDSTPGVVLERGKLAGAFDWDSEVPADERVRWPLSLAWFGGPGPARMVDRHGHGPMPVAANGRYFHLGHHYIIAVDAYNGTELWCRYVPFACFGRGGEPDATIKSISADDESVYLNVGPLVYRLDAQTGRQVGVYGSSDKAERHALDGPKRFEFAAARNDVRTGAVTLAPAEDGLQVEMELRDAALTDSDIWELYFDFRPPERRADLYEPGDPDVFRVVVQASTGRPFPWVAPITPRQLVTKDRMYFTRSSTGELFALPTEASYEMPADVAVDRDDPAIRLGMKFEGSAVDDGTKVRVVLPWADLPAAAGGPPADFAFTATLMSFEGRKNVVRTHPLGTDNTAGILNNGWPVFVLDATANEAPEPEVGSLGDLPPHALEWGRRPARSGTQEVLAPAAFIGDMRTGVTDGRDGLNRQFYIRSYGCGPVVTAAGMDIFRSATLGFYDIEDAAGVHNFGGMKPGCGPAPLPALGLLISSESSSGCRCSYNFQTSLAFAPVERRRNEDWSIYFEPVELGRRVNRTAVNLGAPGDRRDDDGRLWIGYPRDLRVQTGEALALPLVMERDERFGILRVNTDITRVSGTDKPWVSGSCIPGVRRIDVDLRYRDPRWSALSLSETRPPRVDGVLDDAPWDGSQRVVLPDGGTVQLRHDAETLYVGYQRRASLYRPGRSSAWGTAAGEGGAAPREEEPVGLRLASSRPGEWGDFVRFAVSAAGKQYSSHWPSTPEVPRVEGLTPDGRTGDWGEKGFVARVAAGVESRFAWDERGLWILTTLLEDAMTDEKMPGHFTFVAASTTDLGGNRMRLKLDLKECTSSAIHVRGGRDAADVIKVGESEAGDLHVIEALLPFEQVGIEPGAGVELLLPMFYEAPEGYPSRSGERPAQQNFLRKPHLHNSVARLRLAESASAPRPVVLSFASGRTLAFFAVDEKPFAGEWKSAVRRTNEHFTAELAIPWSDIERFGLDRDALRVSFDPLPTPDDNVQALQRFNELGRDFHLDDSPSEKRLYTVRLHFAELDEKVGPGDRVFDVALQGQTVLEGLDVVGETGGHRRALVREFRGIPAERNLRVSFIPRAEELTAQTAPILSGLDIVEERED